jgi:HD superfamily phosphohydrolase
MPLYRTNTFKRKIVNDPVYGFIDIPGDLIFELIGHPWFQRLRRIKQLGLTHLVYPGALHTRFQHSVGAMFLMQQALELLRSKGHKITQEEEESTLVAILFHDCGHGPFSHALENSIVSMMTHEDISAIIMNNLNIHFDQRLTLSIDIFNHSYKKSFLSQLVSSQLDMDRLDYLKRDSFFTGVSEGVIGTERIIKMLDVADDRIVVEAKGIYSLEKFIVARRIMYWQVYLHKTVLAAENMLTGILRRARYLAMNGEKLFATPALSYFLENNISHRDIAEDNSKLEFFTLLDDYDVFTSIKVWASYKDKILSVLCDNLVSRRLFRCEIQTDPFDYFYIEEIKSKIMSKYSVRDEDMKYFFYSDTTSNYAYKMDSDQIFIRLKSGKILDLAEASDQFDAHMISKEVIKHFICYPKDIDIGK